MLSGLKWESRDMSKEQIFIERLTTPKKVLKGGE